MKELYLIAGCKLKCNCGSAVSELKVTSQNFEHVENKLQATEGDKKPNENIFPFGACSLRRRKPCMPQPMMWEGKIDWDKIDSKATLTNKCTLKCAVGGVISVLDAGQSWYGIGKSEEDTSQTNTLAEYVTAKDPIKNIYEIDKDGNINPRGEDEESDKDIIYISDNFTGTGSNRTLKAGATGGYEIGEKGFITNNSKTNSSKKTKYIDFELNYQKGMEYFDQIAGWVKNNKVDVEFIIQRADVPVFNRWGLLTGYTEHTVVGTSGSEIGVVTVYTGNKVWLNGHIHPGYTAYDNDSDDMQVGGSLIPSGFLMKIVPTKKNNYQFQVAGNADEGDNLSAKDMPNARIFIYAPKHDTTIEYKYNTIIKAYGGKFQQ